jgi:BolA protein
MNSIKSNSYENERMQAIRQRLQAALEPASLDIIDDSHKHAGHAGAQGGAGHYSVRIVAERFRGLPPLARHRLVYAALADLLPTEVHALAIKALAPDE